jgi:hypothetical protein
MPGFFMAGFGCLITSDYLMLKILRHKSIAVIRTTSTSSRIFEAGVISTIQDFLRGN